jgi:8-oxo-dGTP diphosphatase
MMGKRKKISVSHSGVYGLFIEGGKILMILKARGPYKGMYDLPGGRIEKNEGMEDALKREFMEEVGCEITSSSFLRCNEYRCEYVGSRGDTIDFFHTATYYNVSFPENYSIKETPDGEDSLGAVFVSIEDIRLNRIKITPIAEKVVLDEVLRK